MLELHQFELSHYVEKVRLILDYKGLAYRKVEVTPGIGQIDLYRLSGQRQVPVLQDGSQIIADSTAIAEYLERQYPDRPIIPTEPKLRGLTLLMEQWADESIGLNARKVLIGALNQDQSFRAALLPSSVPDVVRSLVGAVPGEFLSILGQGVGFGPDAIKTATEAIKRDLASLCFLLHDQPYLVTDHPTLADFAVAGMSMYLKFPTGDFLEIPDALKGKGVPGIADVGTFEPFFSWRDRLYAEYRKPLVGSSSSARSPNAINID
ncbi:glutathione S-transferase family protein [Leptolyngbya sp. FACHB-321]|uniref:glutathione S-transferase family protein n=1 Tax=Leptolyngbya sp. FACHB-321 TaxID=2692807 RepID=UPI001683D319|nr:glutathione S-transferase family protein [Leptolyngbya sp. FACHB-321]MBD2036345.1 glutathione S-transferase family protein [Leptolyngbya sp. FACHB-321]